MTPYVRIPRLFVGLLLAWLTLPASADPPLIVVEDHGGASALPYYQALNPQPDSPPPATPPQVSAPARPSEGGNEADMLPVRSVSLSPGVVQRRVIQAPGLTPLFLVGSDDRSHAWLEQRLPILRELGAVGLVVNVESQAELEALRRSASGLTLSPVAGDDLAARLGLHHYPVLITATGIEQ
ncbi:integrating conjugative element protein [Billgrantia endophytica]|uniref:Integrating conjugative element protein n=1 Tax=Billgrantia endophytica TaxID=2033802 RepID=A0A2N7UE44_9GAMM|nr:integrating conjugative element protein [Halomonas endophytica]PMR78728.1 integrating conjugative element protein [Halomonas endophytica]